MKSHDKESEGLILLTNNGDIVNEILRSENNHEKEYLVTVDKPVTDAFLAGMSSGVRILDTKTKPCKVSRLGKYGVPHHPHPGTQSPDPADVRGIWLWGQASAAGAHY